MKIWRAENDVRTRIDSSYERGLIDEKQKITQYLHLLFEREKMAKQYRGAGWAPLKSGTQVLLDIKNYMGRNDGDEVSETAKKYLDRAIPELERDYISPSGYFSIHYTLKGKNAVSAADYDEDGVPDYIEKTGEAFDYAKRLTCDERGFRIPLTDEGSKAFDVNIYDMKGIYGMTSSKSYFKSSRGVRTASCSISIDNDYSPEKGFDLPRDECMKVTAAHEFFHAVQSAYNVDASKWWKEASATWNEDEVYTSVNDYFRYLGEMFGTPEKSLINKSYGAVVFVKYLSERMGGYGIVKRSWEYQKNYTQSANAIDAALRERTGRDLGTAFNDFTACNYNPSQYYREGPEWNESANIQETYTSYPVESTQDNLEKLASRYYVFRPGTISGGKDLRIIVRTRTGGDVGFKVQKRRKGEKLCETGWVSLRANSRSEITVVGFTKEYEEVCLIPANLDKASNGAGFSFSAVLE